MSEKNKDPKVIQRGWIPQEVANRRRFKWISRIVLLLFFVMTLIIIYGKDWFVTQLENPLLTPVCNIEHLEVVFSVNSNNRGFLYRVRANGDNPTIINEVTETTRLSYQWTLDEKYLVYSYARSNIVFILDTASGQTFQYRVGGTSFEWSFLPDNSGIFVAFGRYDVPDITIPLPPTVDANTQETNRVPRSLYMKEHEVFSLLDTKHTGINRSDSYLFPYARQVGISPDATIMVTTERSFTRRDAPNNHRDIFFYYGTDNEAFWTIGGINNDYDVEHVIQDISPANELLYYRRYYEPADNRKVEELPDGVFIADATTGTIRPIMEDRPDERIRHLTWSQDARHMLQLFNLENNSVDVFLANHEGDSRHFVIRASIFDLHKMLRWTPDGQYLSYVNGTWIYLINLDTREECRVAEVAEAQVPEIRWRFVPESER